MKVEIEVKHPRQKLKSCPSKKEQDESLKAKIQRNVKD